MALAVNIKELTIVTVTPWLQATLDDDPAAVAQWVAEFNMALPEGLRFEKSTAPVVVNDRATGLTDVADAEEETIDVAGQLARLTGYWKARAPFLQRLDEGLRGLGYVPKVPEKRT